MRYLALVLALAACGEDPSLRVLVDLERPPIHKLVISVYESPSLTCEQVEYADLTEAQLAALLVDEQTITGDEVEGALDSLSRTDHKLIVVRGYADTGELLEGGCAEHDLVVEDDSITVKTHVIASVSAQVVLDPDSGEPPVPFDPLRIGVIVTDRDGVTLPDRPVSLRMIGPAGSDPIQATNMITTDDGAWQPERPACTNNKGTTAVFPIVPNIVGGFAAKVRVAWANQVATQFSGIANTASDLGLANLTIATETKHPCAVSVKRTGSALTRRLVCVDGTIAKEFPVTVANGVTTLGPPTMTSLGTLPIIGLFALPVESDPLQREIYAVDSDGKVTALFGAAPAQATLNCSECTGSVVDAIVAPACGPRDVEKLVLVVRSGGEDKVKAMPSRGGVAIEIRGLSDSPRPYEVALRNAGCVAQIGPAGYEERQLTVVDLHDTVLDTIASRGFYACIATACKRVNLPVGGGAVGFTSNPPYLVGTSIDATGIVLATWALISDPNDESMTTDLLIERRPAIPSSALPGHIAVGTFDEDDGVDMAWDGSRGRVTQVELAYTSVDGLRLQALSDPLALALIDMFATDVTNDDHDDIIIVARKPATSQSGVVIVPTHTVAPPKSIPVPTCGS